MRDLIEIFGYAPDDLTVEARSLWNLGACPFIEKSCIPTSNHGLNWANVHKRLIPQLIRKGIVYSRSQLVRKGLYFIVPDIVYAKFEDITGYIPQKRKAGNNTITVFTYKLGQKVGKGKKRKILPSRTIRFLTTDFANRFIQGSNLPSGENLDDAVSRVLGIK